MLKPTLILFALLSVISLFAQSTPTEAASIVPDSLSEEGKMRFIIDHFYSIYSDNLDQGITLAAYADSVATALNLDTMRAEASLCLGIGNYLRGNYPEALTAFQTSSDLFDSLKHNSGIARINNEMAVFYRKHDNFDKMLECLDKGEIAAKAANDLVALSTNYHHRGTVHSRQEEYEKAYPWFIKVLELRTEIKDSLGLGYIYMDLAEYETVLGSLEKAMEYIDLSSAIRQKMGDKQGVAINEVAKGEVYFTKGLYKASIPYFENTIKLAKAINYTDLIGFAYYKLQEAHKAENNYEAAYNSLAQFQVYNDSIYNVERSRALAEMQEKYESAKKEQQIQQQEYEIAQKDAQLEIQSLIVILLFIFLVSIIAIGLLIRKRMILQREKLIEQEKTKNREMEIKAVLDTQEKERSRVAKDLHDGFGQMISILNLNVQSLENPTADKQQIFEQSTKVLEDMYRELKGICFNLMPQTLIKSGLPAAVKEFTSRINNTGKLWVNTDFFGLDDRLTDVQEISLYRIIQEWVNNVIKYSDATKMDVQITKDEKELTLMIEDNGSGFDKNALIEGKGNGWRNMNSRANLLKGELELDTHEGQRGNALIVNIPMINLAEPQEAAQSTLS